MVRSAIAKDTISVSTRLMDGLVLVQGDRVQLQQVLVNLILNAVEAMSSVEGGTRELSIRTEQNQPGGILVAVHDSGPGIDPVNFDRVFEPFTHQDQRSRHGACRFARPSSNGHGGRLWMRANEPRGRYFIHSTRCPRGLMNIFNRRIGLQSRTQALFEIVVVHWLAEVTNDSIL